ncbi:hypothetical protein JCM6882_008143 [Rhodosporidiobolus microsporus]
MATDYRLSISDAGSVLFPRTPSSRTPPSLLSRYTPIKPTGQRGTATRAVQTHCHEECSELSRTGKPVFISPGLIASPNLRRDYSARGWAAPGVQWANFRPALLRIDHLGPAKKNQFRLQVVGIKSTHPDAVPGNVRATPARSRFWRKFNPLSPFNPQLYQGEEFQLAAYRFFLTRLLSDFKKQQGYDLLNRLSISRTSAMWRYSGCYSHTCTEHDCFLNVNPMSPEWLIGRLNVVPVQDDPEWIKRVLFEDVPQQLGIRRAGGSGDSRGMETITTGFAHVSLEEPVEYVHSAWVL